MSETKAIEPAREVDAGAVEEVKPAIASRTQTTTARKTVSAKDLETAKITITGDAIKFTG
jgi:Cu/Ag efflux protein CusF